MICVSLIEKKPENILSLIRQYPLAEIRLEYLEDAGTDNVHSIFSSHKQLIATYRGISTEDSLKEKTLITAIQSGACYVDVEIEENEEYKSRIFRTANDYNCKTIISYHNYKITPEMDELKNLLSSCRSYHADIIKIACMANNETDTARLLSLYSEEKNLIALSMGPHGQISE